MANFEIDYSFLDDYFEELVNKPDFKATHPDYELTDKDFDYIFGDLLVEMLEQGFGISTYAFIKKKLQEYLNDDTSDNLSAIRKITEQLVEETERVDGVEKPSDIEYWEFYENGCELAPITRKRINMYFIEFLAREE